MVTLEQIKLLESKLTRAINFVSQLTEENNRLKKQNDEFEETIISLKEEKTRVEEVIVSALGKLNQFEDVIEHSLSSVKSSSKSVQKEGAAQVKTTAEPLVKPPHQTANQKPAVSIVQDSEAENSTPVEKTKPVVPSAYTIDETGSNDSPEDDFESIGESEDIEDSGEAELDIF